MSMTGSASGVVKVGDPNSPDFSFSINPTTGEITQWNQVRKIVPQNTSNQAINVGNITKATLISLKFTNASTGVAQYVTLRLNGTITLPDQTDILLCHGGTPGTPITSIEVTTQAAAGDTVVEGVIAGT